MDSPRSASLAAASTASARKVGTAILVTLTACICSCDHSTTGPAGAPFTIAFRRPQTSQGTQAFYTITVPGRAEPGGMLLKLTFSGVAVGYDTLTLPPDTTDAPLTGFVYIPVGIPDGTFNVTATLAAIGLSTSTSLLIKDTEPPRFTSASVISGIGGYEDATVSTQTTGVLIAGAADTAKLSVTDNHALAWTGWILNSTTQVGDSGRVSDTSATLTLPMTIAQSLVADSATLTFFATDVDGNRATATVSDLTVAALTSHPTLIAPRGARISDVAFDTTRGLVYLAKPDSQQVAVLSLASMTYQAPIQMPAAPVALDLTPGGNSLVVGLDSPAVVKVVNLASPARPIVGSFQFDSVEVPEKFMSLRVAADNRMIGYIGHWDQEFGFWDVIANELNLTTGTWTAIDSGGCGLQVAASSDRSHVLMLNCPSASTIYSAATHTVTVTSYWGYSGEGSNLLGSGSTGGRYYQIAHVFMDSTITGLIVGNSSSYGAAAAPNGDFYLGEAACSLFPCSDALPGIAKRYSLPTTQPLEYAIIPHPAYEFTVSPNGSTLVGIGADSVMAMDLTHSAPLSSTVRARLQKFRPSRTVLLPSKHLQARRSPPTFEVHLAGRLLAPVAVAPAP